MNYLDLMKKVKEKGGVKKVLSQLKTIGISMGLKTFYKKSRGILQFRLKEILALSKVLNLKDEEIMTIFFNMESNYNF